MSNKYAAYPEYKNSGVDWLDVIPNEWSRLALKFILTMRSGDSITSLNIDIEGTYPVYGGNGLRGYTENYTHDGEYILIGRQGALCGNINLATGKFWASEHALVVSPSSSKTVVTDWLRYLLTSMNLNQYSVSAAQPGLSAEVLLNLQIPFPSESECKKISEFLNYETVRIDRLIEKQQRLIELLKEKRQAVISHAVTKGLNPDAPMKDSGVEWLGQVPEHWIVTRFKFLCDNIIAGPFGSSITKDMYRLSGYKVYGQEQVIPNNFEIGDYFISRDDYERLSRYKVQAGDVLISCVGTFGKIAVFPNNAPEGIINPRLIKAKIADGSNPQFIRELLKSQMVFKQFEQLSRGGTMGVINIAILNEIIVGIPPLYEQTEIYNYVCEQKLKYGKLIDISNQMIEYLTERRTALISAAVTGKIDVSGWRIPIKENVI